MAMMTFGISEKQQLVVATNSMPKKDWQKTRAFSWMTAFLHFNKILQIPIIIYHHLTGQDYKSIINFFVNEQSKEFNLISKIRKYFFDSALTIQNGGPEYKFSKEWLNIWWPHDEYMLLKLYKNNLISDFYKEAENLLLKKMISHDPNLDSIQKSTKSINHDKLSNAQITKRDKNYEVKLNYNIIDFYKSVLVGKKRNFNKENLIIKLREKMKHGFQTQIGQKRLFGMQIKKELICMEVKQ